MKKLVFVLFDVLILVAFSIPIANLFIKPAPSTKLTDARKDDPLFVKAAGPLQAKCMPCHAQGVELPFYAGFPVAKQIIRQDIDEGIEHYDFISELLPPGNRPAGEVALAKMEFSVTSGSMPPLRYFALHWDGVLSSSEKNDLLSWIREVRRKHYATPGYPAEVQERPLQPLPKAVDLSAAKVALGDRLYHDKRLSKDDTIACASCHELAKGGTDLKQFSDGVGGAKGDINSPTTYNSGFNFIQFWDGRAADLEEQADGPVNNPIEMASNWNQVIGKLQKDEALTGAFRAVYPDGYSSKNIRNAIAEFERSLITPNSRFDRFLAGDASALDEKEEAGYRVFQEHGCHTCHVGKILGGQSFEKMGVYRDYFGDRGNIKKPDLGRFNVTQKERDRHRFKVPTLRNIAWTAPYFHDGSVKDLEQAAAVMAKYNTEEEFSQREAEIVSKFLEALTGEYQGKPVQ